MASLDRESIEQLARDALDTLRGGQKDDNLLEEATAGVRQQVERVVDSLQKQYGQTRLTARAEIDGFLNDLKGIDPALPGIVADAANEMTGRKGHHGVALLGVAVALIIGAVTLLWLRSPETYRSLVDAIGRPARE